MLHYEALFDDWGQKMSLEGLHAELELSDLESLEGLNKTQRLERARDLLEELSESVGGADVSTVRRALGRVIVLITGEPQDADASEESDGDVS
jgi:hypothetical protein